MRICLKRVFGEKNSRRRKMGTVFALSVLFAAGYWVWQYPEPEQREPSWWAVFDWTPVMSGLVDGVRAVEVDVGIDPYSSDPIELRHRPPDFAAEPFVATILSPPRLISKFGVWPGVTDDEIATSAIWLSALLPHAELRTPQNHARFEGKQDDRLDVLIGNRQSLGKNSDYWWRDSSFCEDNPIVSNDPQLAGLHVDPNKSGGSSVFMGCAPNDVLPLGLPPLFVCSKSRVSPLVLEVCKMQFTIPWQSYGEEIHRKRPVNSMSGSKLDWGISAHITFSGRYLPQWRRIRDLSFCLIESVVQEIDKIEVPSRNEEMCALVKAATETRQATLVTRDTFAN